MPNLLACPGQERVRQLAAGKAAEHELLEFAEHLENCCQCADQVESLEAYQQVLAEVRQGVRLAADGPAEDPSAAHALEATAVDCAAATHSSVEVEPLQSPVQLADDLGQFGSFHNLKLLGSGGMGVVFRAEDMQLKRQVALKVMRPELAARPTYRERFLREAQAAAALEHDHIVPIYQVGEERGMPFFAMPWLKGMSLSDWLQRRGQLPIPHVLRLGRQIALGLEAAHQHGLIHRDIKPGNLWLETVASGQCAEVGVPPSGGLLPPERNRLKGELQLPATPAEAWPLATDVRIKILDFGLARPIADSTQLTQQGVVIGTPAYMAPEQASGAAADHRSDLFSLGVVLYQMCTGQMPFKGDNVMAVLTALAVQTPPRPQTLNAEVPAELDALIMQLLAKEPAERPATARAVAERLESLQRRIADSPTAATVAHPQRQTPTAAPATCPAPVRKLPRRWPWVAVAAALLLAGSWFLPGIIVRIFDEKGKEIARFEVPDGKSASIEVPGQPAVKVPLEEGKDPRKETKKDPDTKPGLRAVSWLDQIDREKIPPQERFDWQPKELVAVLGEHRQRYWDSDNQGAWSVAWSGNGNWIASMGWSEDGPALWDASTMKRLPMPDVKHEPRLGGATNELVAFSPDSKTLVFSRNKTLWLFDMSTATPTVRAELICQGGIYGFAFSSDGAILAARDPQAVHLWDVSQAEPRELPSLKAPGGTQHYRGIAFGHKARILACTTSKVEDKTWIYQVHLWDLTDPKKPMEKVLEASASTGWSLAFGPDDTTLFGAGGEVQWWDLARDAKEPKRLPEVNAQYLQVCPVSKIMVASRHFLAGDCSVCDVSGSPRLMAQHSGRKFGFRQAAFSPDGQALASVGRLDGSLRVWDLHQGKLKERNPLQGHVGPVVSLAFRGNDTQLISACSGDATVRLWDLTPDPRVKRVHTCPTDNVRDMAAAPNGKTVALAAGSAGIVWHDVTAEKPREILRIPGETVAVAFPGTDTLALAGFSGGIGLWDLDPLAERPHLDRDAPAIKALAAAKGALAYWRHGKEAYVLRVWSDLDGGVPRSQDLKWKTGAVSTLAFSPDGKRLVAGGPRGLQIWTASGDQWQELDHIPITDRTWNTSTFSADGLTFAASDAVGNVIYRDMTRSWKDGVVRTWRLPGGVNSLAFAEDGRHLALGNANGTIYILRVAKQ